MGCEEEWLFLCSHQMWQWSLASGIPSASSCSSGSEQGRSSQQQKHGVVGGRVIGLRAPGSSSYPRLTVARPQQNYCSPQRLNSSPSAQLIPALQRTSASQPAPRCLVLVLLQPSKPTAGASSLCICDLPFSRRHRFSVWGFGLFVFSIHLGAEAEDVLHLQQPVSGWCTCNLSKSEGVSCAPYMTRSAAPGVSTKLF